jgi:hypothetical protein
LSNPSWRQAVQRLRSDSAASIAQVVSGLWNNPLLSRERQLQPLPRKLVSRTLPITAGALTLLPIIAWAFDSRWGGAALLGVCLGMTLIPVLAAPILSATFVFAARDASVFTAISPGDAAIGCTLRALWRIRWLVMIGLALTPALIVSLLRLDVAAFSAYRESALALGSAAPPEQMRLLLPGGAIPYFRLSLRAVSGGLLPWALLPLSAVLGTSGALLLNDATLGQIASVVAVAGILVISGLAWNWLSITPLLARPLEAVRLALLVAMLAGYIWLAWLISRRNARLLLAR